MSKRFPRGDTRRREEITNHALALPGPISERWDELQRARSEGEISPGPLPTYPTLCEWLKEAGWTPERDGAQAASTAPRSPNTRDRTDPTAELRGAEYRVNKLAAALQAAGLFEGKAVIRHRFLLKAIGRARSAKRAARMRRVAAVARSHCSEYENVLREAGVTNRSEVSPHPQASEDATLPAPAETAAHLTLSERPSEAPRYGAPVGWDEMPKADRDARIRAILCQPHLSGEMSSEECADMWKQRIASEDLGDRALLELAGLPRDGLDSYRNVSARSIRRWADRARERIEAALESGEPPPPAHQALRHLTDGRARRPPKSQC